MSPTASTHYFRLIFISVNSKGLNLVFPYRHLVLPVTAYFPPLDTSWTWLRASVKVESSSRLCKSHIFVHFLIVKAEICAPHSLHFSSFLTLMTFLLSAAVELHTALMPATDQNSFHLLQTQVEPSQKSTLFLSRHQLYHFYLTYARS